MNNLVAITIGDINGIGIRLILKLYNENKIKNFVLVTNINYFKKFLKTNNISLNINVINQNKGLF